MAKSSKLSGLPIKSLLKMRDEIAEIIASKTSELQKQLSALNGESAAPKTRRGSRKGKSVAPQFRSRQNPKLVWSGRGMTPLWMREEMKGTKLTKENFRIKS